MDAAVPVPLHLAVVFGAPVVGIPLVIVSALDTSASPVAAWSVLVILLGIIVVLTGLVSEGLRFLLPWRPLPPQGAQVLQPDPEPARGGRTAASRGLVRRARLWADASEVGVISRLHTEQRWSREDVQVLRVERLPDGTPGRVEFVDTTGRVRGHLVWWLWFPDEDLEPVRQFAERAGLAVEDVAWQRRRPASDDAVDGSNGRSTTAAAQAHLAHALGLGIVAVAAAAEVDTPTGGGPGMAGVVVGGIAVLVAVIEIVVAFQVGWGDRRVAR